MTTATTDRQAQPRVGEHVHFVLNAGPNAGAHRPAIIVRIVSGSICGLQVFTDGTRSKGDAMPNVFWVPASRHGGFGEHGTWHYPEDRP